jgi:hypothetical protein
MERIKQKDVEHWVEGPLTDKEWENINKEIEGRLENFIDGLLAELVQDYCDGIFSEGT